MSPLAEDLIAGVCSCGPTTIMFRYSLQENLHEHNYKMLSSAVKKGTCSHFVFD